MGFGTLNNSSSHIRKGAIGSGLSGVSVATLALMISPAPAHAVTVNSVAVDSANAQLNNCVVTATVNVTGTTNDGGATANSDEFQAGTYRASGQRFNSPQSRFVQVGATADFTVAMNTSTTGGPRDNYVVNILDASPTGSPIISTTPIPRAMLVAAGGSCASLAVNSAPVADAGPDQNFASGGATANLNGSGSSDPDMDSLTYLWDQISGPSVTLNGANTATPTFTLPRATSQQQTFRFRLRVSDGVIAGFVSDEVDIFIAAATNTPPVVDAGPDQTAPGSSQVALSGTASDPDGDPLNLLWTQISGPSVALTNANSLTASFTAPPRSVLAQTLVFELAADDGVDASTDRVTIVVPGNQPPTANISGPGNAAGGTTIVLDGSGSSDPEQDPLFFNWTQVSGPAANIVSPTDVSTDVVLPAATNSAQVLVFQLLVADTFDGFDTRQFAVTIAANNVPVADAGVDQNVAGGSNVTLDGSASSDPDGDAIAYSWVQTGGPAVTLDDANAERPTFTAPASTGSAQSLSFELTVTDPSGSSATDSVEITIAANRPPIADAGPDQGPVDSGQTVTLDGSASSDPDGDGLTYRWVQVSGTSVTLAGANGPTPSFSAPMVNGTENLVFQLIVNDGQADSVADTVSISVRAIGSVTIVQQIIGSDVTIAFTSDIPALNTSVTTSGGIGRITAAGVAAGSHMLSAADLTSTGYAVTSISCNDADSTVNIANRTVALQLSPGEDLVCTFRMANSREAASIAIGNFLTGRNALILAHQPDLQRRLDRLENITAGAGSASIHGVPVPGSGKLPFKLNTSAGTTRFSASLAGVEDSLGISSDPSSQPLDIWAEAYFSKTRLGGQNGKFSILYAGADYRASDDLLIGAVIEFDTFSDNGDLTAGEAEGDGWMAGPYVTARLAPQMFAEFRAAWGSSDNRVNPLGSYVDSFDTSRSLYSGSIIGQFDLGDDTVLRPEVTVRHIEERQKAYTDSLGVAVPNQTIGQGDVSFKPRLSHVIESDSGWSFRPYGEVEGIVTFGSDGLPLLANLQTVSLGDLNGFRMRVEAGIDLLSSEGFRASVSGSHDGIGSDNFRATGIHIGLSFGF